MNDSSCSECIIEHLKTPSKEIGFSWCSTEESLNVEAKTYGHGVHGRHTYIGYRW